MVYVYKETKPFILQTVILSLCFLFWFAIFIPLTGIRYPEAADLQYETCTYLSYEYKPIGRSSYQYRIWVKEYDAPLIIDNIVQRATDRSLLESLQSGDPLQISLEDHDGFYLYEVSAHGDDILSYEDYLASHRNNERIGIIFFALVSVISFSFLVTGIIYYIKTGNALKGFSL
jgi:hypothetical protein